MREVKDVFKRYLTPGKPGYVQHEWATLSNAVDWIHAAGGSAVVAHPGRYKVSADAECGACWPSFATPAATRIEVLSSSHTPAQYRRVRDAVAGLRARRLLRLRLSWSRRELDGSRRPAGNAGRRRTRMEGLVVRHSVCPLVAPAPARLQAVG